MIRKRILCFQTFIFRKSLEKGIQRSSEGMQPIERLDVKEGGDIVCEEKAPKHKRQMFWRGFDLVLTARYP